MLYKFYGFTATNLILFSMSPRLYKKLLDSSNKDYKTLYLLDKQFKELESFLDSIPTEYVDIKDKRTYSKLRRLEKEDPSNPAIVDLRNSLSNAEVDVSSVYMINGERVEISSLSKSILLEMKNQLNRIRSYHSQIKLEESLVSETEEFYFGVPLYRLRSYTERTLCNIFINNFVNYIQTNSPNNLPEFWIKLEELVNGLSKYVTDDDKGDVNLDLTETAVEEVIEFIDGLNYKVLNAMFGEHSEKEYHESSLELHKIGLIGFTPFVNELFKEFYNTYSPSYVSKTYINKSTDLYRFYSMCKRGLDSNLELFADLAPVVDEEEIEIKEV